MKISTPPLILFLLALILTGCRGKFYTMPSGSMEATLPLNSKAFVTETHQFKHNHIAVYYYYGYNYSKPQTDDGQYEREWQKRISRLIAMSGDTLQLKDGNIYVNGKEVPHAPKSLLLYEIRSGVDIEDFPEREENKYLTEKAADGVLYKISLTREEANDYSNRKPAIKSVRRILNSQFPVDSFYAKECGNPPANTDNLGPLYIPRPGDTITVSECNRKLYANVPGIQPGKNVIKEKLFYMISDNWYGAEDSRYIGFISESKMFGIVKE